MLNVISKYISSYQTIIASRFFTGIFCGLFTGILPIYLYELAPKNLRGMTGTMNQLTVVLGILSTNILGLPQMLGTDKLWPVLVGLIFVPSFIHLGLFFAVKSPKHLFINCNDRDAAEKGFTKFICIYNVLILYNNHLYLKPS